MKTTYILIAIIIIVLFSLFYRLYNFKLENFNENRVCNLKKPNFREEKIYTIFFNTNTPIAKGGTIKFNTGSHDEFIQEFLKLLISRNINFNRLYAEKIIPESEESEEFKTHKYVIKDYIEPTTQPPTTQPPTTQSPTTQPPTTQPPTTQSPTTQSPTTQSPTTQSPTTQPTTTQSPTTQSPTTQPPTTTTSTPITTSSNIITDIKTKTFNDMIKDFCTLQISDDETLNCVFFAVQIEFKLSQSMLDNFIKLSLTKDENDEEYNLLVKNVGELKNYNSISQTFFETLHAAKNFYFSRKYVEDTNYINELIENYNSEELIPTGALELSMPDIDFISEIIELNNELENSSFDNETLIEELYSLKKLNLLDIKRNIKDKIYNDVCEGDLYIPERLLSKKELIKYLGDLDKNALKIQETTGLKSDEINETSKIYAKFHEKYKTQLEELIKKTFDNSDPDTDEKMKEYEEQIVSLNKQITNINKKNSKHRTSFDDFYLKKKVSLQNLADGSILNFSRVIENAKFVDKYMIFVNDGCLKYNGFNLSIEYDWKYQMRNPQIHFNIEVIETEKDYLAKMNYITIDKERNSQFSLKESPVVLISPYNLYGKVLVLKESRIFIENCTGILEEQFIFRSFFDNVCSYDNNS